MFARHDFEVFSNLKIKAESYLGEFENRRILDVGCGQRYPLTLLFHNTRNDVVGCDLGHIKSTWESLRHDGLERTLKTTIRKILYDRTYYKQLESISGFKLSQKNIDLRYSDVTNLPFIDNSFDFVVSNAVLEHVADISSALSEIRRVLKPDGITYHNIHLFCSLSGGHSFDWSYPDENLPRAVPPWDHLRANLFPAHVYLNKLREKDYLLAFESNFRILEWLTAKTEGERILTPELEHELCGYSREELSKREITVIARKDSRNS
ncbi:MAG TPA: methyltransferase domain-containing protein [Terriglobales bacterium]|nr:methyltransferase domain-containing protein [Terriglobales bacterium]